MRSVAVMDMGGWPLVTEACASMRSTSKGWFHTERAPPEVHKAIITVYDDKKGEKNLNEKGV